MSSVSNYPTILDTIGKTPLISLPRTSQELGARILGKAEFFNPLGSVKDRIGKAMIEDAEDRGALRKGMEVIEPTSGNTGIALAFVCAAKGYSITLVMPETMSAERRTLLLLLGAKLVLTPAASGMRGAIAKARELIDEKKGQAFMPSQFDNPANSKIHEKTTAEEIWAQTSGGQFDAFIAGVGTAGTIAGCGHVFKSRKAEIKIFAVEPSESSVLSGGKPGPHKIQGLGAGFVPGNYNRKVVDGVLQVSSEMALKRAKWLIVNEGVPAGISTGAVVEAAQTLITQFPEYKNKTIVVVLPSYTERYLSTLLADPERELAKTLPVSSVNDDYLKKVPLGADS